MGNANGCPSSTGEHDGPGAAHQHPVLGVQAHGAGEDDPFDVAAYAASAAGSSAWVTRTTSCSMIGPSSRSGGDVVGGGADELHAAVERLLVGLGALEAGQERVVDVDDPAW
jgi:hypothetical protein